MHKGTKYLQSGRAALLKLVAHLKGGELAHKKFRFGLFNSVGPGEFYSPTHCGTLGCAIGELPKVFPSTWWFTPNHMPVLRRLPLELGARGCASPDECASHFFGIDLNLCFMLFYPYESRPWAPGMLSDEATKYEVADSIERFVKWYDKKVKVNHLGCAA